VVNQGLDEVLQLGYTFDPTTLDSHKQAALKVRNDVLTPKEIKAQDAGSRGFLEGAGRRNGENRRENLDKQFERAGHGHI